MTTKKKVCAVVGVGPGNGAALGRRFAKEGYAVALLARTTATSGPLAESLPDARAYVCDVFDPEQVTEVFAAIEREMGPVATLVYNAGSSGGAPSWGTVEEVEPAALESSFRVNALGLLLVAKKVIPQMRAQGGGNIVVIGATASRRGVARTAGFAPAKAAQRSLAESMARHLWPQKIHVSLVIVDGVVDLPRTRALLKDKPDDFFVAPDGVADVAFHLTVQPPSAWSFEVEARPFRESW
jgi:NAD(P)-dependent dehydrogenase (short-subunit alcohol dehydrogenase family)